MGITGGPSAVEDPTLDLTRQGTFLALTLPCRGGRNDASDSRLTTCGRVGWRARVPTAVGGKEKVFRLGTCMYHACHANYDIIGQELMIIPAGLGMHVSSMPSKL